MSKEIIKGHPKFKLNPDGSVEIGGKVLATEITLAPKIASSGTEGTIFYDSDDDHIYVATE